MKWKLPDGWRWVKLSAVCELNPRRPLIDRSDDTPTSFIPMESVNAVSGTVTDLRIRPFGEIKKGYTYFADGDVLFAKITPCMQNGKHAIAQWLLDGIGFGTTEFHVLRPRTDIVSEWIHFFVRQPAFLFEATEHFTGTVGQQRVPQDYLSNCEIPLPPIPEQQRISAILKGQMAVVDKTRAASQARFDAIKALPAAFLKSAFQGLSSQSWPKLPFGKVAMLQRGHDLTERERKEGPYPVVTSSGIVGKHAEYRMKGPGVVTGRSGSVGRVHFIKQDYWPHNTVLYVKDFFGNDPRYIYFLLNWINVKTVSSGTGVPTLDRKEVHKITVTHPPLKEQHRLADMLLEQMNTTEKARIMAEAELNTINALPASLLRRAFAGEI